MSIHYYANLLGFENRIDAFRRAIEQVVRPGDHVLEVGTGLGTFAIFAARSGAARVVGIDSSPVVHVAETVALANGLEDRIEFVRGEVPGPDLGRFDLIIYEDFPVNFLDGPTHGLLGVLAAEYLAEGGRMLPSTARMAIAPVRSPWIREDGFPLGSDRHERFGIDWSPLRPLLANQPRQMFLPSSAMAGEPVRGSPLPLLPAPDPKSLGVSGEWDADSAGVITGLAIWFEMEVCPGEWISNVPRDESEPWGQWVLPVDPPLRVDEGSVLRADVSWERTDEGGPGWVAWSSSVDGERRRGHEFAGRMFGVEDLEASTDLC